MSLYSTAGCKVFIGGALEQKAVDFVAADFTPQTWVEITSIESMGSIGDSSSPITQDLIDQQRQKTIKGIRIASPMELVCAIDLTDPGQLALIAAERTPYDYAFKVELNDKPATGGSPKNSLRYFIGKVMSQTEVYDTANNVRKLNASVGVNSNLVRVAASAT